MRLANSFPNFGGFFRRSISELLENQSREFEQARLDGCTRQFSAALDEAIPPQFMADYARSSMSSLGIPDVESDLRKLLPVIEFSVPRPFHSYTLNPRMRRCGLFTGEEVLDFCDFCIRHPELPLTTVYLQQCMRDALLELGARTIQANGGMEDAAAERFAQNIEFLRFHVTSINMHRLLPVSAYIALASHAGTDATFDDLSQEDYANGYRLLSETGAFTAHYDLPGGNVSIHCPAHEYVRKLIVDEKILGTIAEHLRHPESFPAGAAAKFEEHARKLRARMTEIGENIREHGPRWITSERQVCAFRM